ncbi:ABC transporter permease subunit [Gorillibacterium sp. CAU 1737]|uniref:ABC transporter permease subunit n=1 Tax=Gorillibacterium sp. CAU 1737 TaxID=3140362 RepID=UPI0032607532
MNLLRMEWRALRRSTLLWSLALAATAVLLLAFYPGFARDAAIFNKLLDAYPDAVKQVIGLKTGDLTSLNGYFSFVLTYLSLAAAIQATNAGLGPLSREVRDKTADFLLAKPVTRTQVVTAKLIAALFSLLVTNLVLLLTVLAVAGGVSSEVDYGPLALLTLTVGLIQLLFWGLGLFLAALLPKVSSVLPLSLSVVFGFFAVGMVASLVGERAARYLTPFRYYDPAYIRAHSAYEGGFLLLELALLVLLTATAYIVYRRKDIHAV